MKMVIRCDMCSSDDNCEYDHKPKYPCKDMLGPEQVIKLYSE